MSLAEITFFISFIVLVLSLYIIGKERSNYKEKHDKVSKELYNLKISLETKRKNDKIREMFRKAREQRGL